MRYVGRNVEKVPGSRDKMLFKSFAIPYAGFATQYMERRFVAIVLMRLGQCPGRDYCDLEINSPRSDRLPRNPRRAQISMLSDEFWPRADDLAGGCHVTDHVRHSLVVYFDSAKSPAVVANRFPPAHRVIVCCIIALCV